MYLYIWYIWFFFKEKRKKEPIYFYLPAPLSFLNEKRNVTIYPFFSHVFFIEQWKYYYIEKYVWIALSWITFNN